MFMLKYEDKYITFESFLEGEMDEFKWTSCSSSHGIMSSGDPYSAHLSDSIPMSQYPGDYCPASVSLMRRSSGYNPEDRESDGRSPSPPPQHHHQCPDHHQQYTLEQQAKSDYNCRTFGPHPFRNPAHQQQQHRVQVQIPMPNCLLDHDGLDETDETSFNGEALGAGGGGGGGSIRLYMNQSAGEDELQLLPETSTLPRSTCPTYSNTNSLRRTTKPSIQMSPPSSNSGNTSVSNTGGNPSPSTGSTTLVSALKRHNSSGTPNTTVKKRVQIQEISV